MSAGRRIAVLTLGCPRNIVDSEVISHRLRSKDFSLVDIADADTVIVNTCAFIKEAVEESIEQILSIIQLKKEGRINKIIVAGCLSGRYKKQLVRLLPEVDAFMGPLTLDDSPGFNLTPKHYSYLKICEGCANSCSFCAIPMIKGPLKSRSIDSIIEQARTLDNNNVKEINIVGQDITVYGLDLYKKNSLEKLLSTLCSTLKNVKWLRLLYLDPAKITDSLLSLIAKESLICKYIDMPIQHVNKRILSDMKRQGSKSELKGLIDRIRRFIPSAAIRTSVMVGFPGETEKEFSELVDFIKEVRFERLGAFIFSPEEGTPAFSFTGQVSVKEKNARFDKIMSIQQEIAKEYNQKQLGKTMDVIIDEKCPDSENVYLARTRIDAPEVDGSVFVEGKDVKLGQILKVKITDTFEYDLKAVLI